MLKIQGIKCHIVNFNVLNFGNCRYYRKQVNSWKMIVIFCKNLKRNTPLLIKQNPKRSKAFLISRQRSPPKPWEEEQSCPPLMKPIDQFHIIYPNDRKPVSSKMKLRAGNEHV